jgi:hypothetical protein
LQLKNKSCFKDTFCENRTRLGVKIDTITENLIVPGNSNGNHFMRLYSEETLIITCSKMSLRNGTLQAFVNSKLIQPLHCTRYYKHFMISDENYCQSKQFITRLNADRSSFVEISCRIIESVYYYDTLSLIFTKICEFKLEKIH